MAAGCCLEIAKEQKSMEDKVRQISKNCKLHSENGKN